MSTWFDIKLRLNGLPICLILKHILMIFIKMNIVLKTDRPINQPIEKRIEVAGRRLKMLVYFVCPMSKQL